MLCVVQVQTSAMDRSVIHRCPTECVYVSLSVIRCINNSLHQRWVGRRSRTKKNLWDVMIASLLPRLLPCFGSWHPLMRLSDYSHWILPHSVVLLWTGDQPYVETSTWQHTTLTRDKPPWPRRDSNPPVPSKRAASDPHLRPRGQWDWRSPTSTCMFMASARVCVWTIWNTQKHDSFLCHRKQNVKIIQQAIK